MNEKAASLDLDSIFSPESSQWDGNQLVKGVPLMLGQAEQLFGPRLNSQLKIGRIYFASRKTQHGRLEFESNDEVNIRMFKHSATHGDYALWELGHVCVHLLSPARVAVTFLEEGLACWFARLLAEKHPKIFPESARVYPYGLKTRSFYYEALFMVDSLLKHDPSIIKKLREIQPAISLITAEMIVQNVPSFPFSTARELEKQFSKKWLEAWHET